MNDRHEEELLGRILKESATERAPDHFSQAVMDRILAGGVSPVEMPPLIPRWGWGLIILALATMAGWGWYGGKSNGEGLLPEAFWTGWLELARLPGLDLPSVPPSLAYGAAALALFTLLQILWMRRRLERHWAV